MVPENTGGTPADSDASAHWLSARQSLAGLADGGLNIAFEAVDRHVQDGFGDRMALRCVDRRGIVDDITYGRLADLTGRFASLLQQLGVRPGDAVFTLLGREPAVYITALGTLKAGGVFCPLFSAYGPDPIRTRLRHGRGRVLVTTAQLYKRKVAQIRADLPDLEHVLVVDDPWGQHTPAGSIDFAHALEAATPMSEPPRTSPNDPALLFFTSGTTGAPKGAQHAHAAVVVHRETAQRVFGLGRQDVFWCTADPGWVTGTCYGIIAPLTAGATVVADREEFDAVRWYRLLQDQAVTVWYTAPTAIRMLMRLDSTAEGRALTDGLDLSALRLMASVGEPLNPQAVLWGEERFGRPFHDTWWQTETGGIMIANLDGMKIRPGSMGKPLPGVVADIVEHAPDGRIEQVTEPDQPGMLALKTGWPSLFRGYLGDDERYRAAFADGWYLTGDLARRDRDGYYWFVGRADDVIKSAGHLIGPFEVESALMNHPAVAEVGVAGKPDPIAGEIVVAYVSLKPGHTGDAELRRTLMSQARQRLGAAVAPRDIVFVETLPKTNSGKILRRELRTLDIQGETAANTPRPNDGGSS